MFTVLPMCGYVGTRFIEMNVLVYVIYPRQRNKMMVLSIWRALFCQLDLFISFEVIDLSDRFPIGRDNVHVFLDLGCIRHLPLLREL
jgi:hypothetical protein